MIENAKKIIAERCRKLAVTEKMLQRAVCPANCAAIRQVLEKLRRGESVTLVQLGGSITEGYFSTSREKSQGGQVFTFLDALYPGKVTFINAGIAATGAVYGAYRLQQDVLRFNPQLVIIEYNINDRASNSEGMAAYESIIRVLWQRGIAVICLFNTVYSENRECAAGSRSLQMEIAQHYSLPTADANKAFFGEAFYQKSTEADSYFRENDGTHPTDAGHARVGLLVCYLLYLIMKEAPCAPLPLKKPLIPESLYITDKAQIIKAQEIRAGHELVSFRGGEYLSEPQSVGQNIILGERRAEISGGTRQSNTYSAFLIPSGESAEITLRGVCDAFIIILQNKFGSEHAEFTTLCEGKIISSLTMNAHYSGALTVEHSRIINCDHRVYHGEKRDITVSISARDGNVYVGGVLAVFE